MGYGQGESNLLADSPSDLCYSISMKNAFSNLKTSINPIWLRFSGLEFLFWAACSAYYSFSIVYLTDRGFSTTSIGAIVAVNSCIMIFAQPFWGMISDWLQSIKKVFLLCMTAASLLLLLVPLFEWALLVGLLLAFVTFFESALVPLLDSWVIGGIKNRREISYGSIRLWGSLGFAAMAFVLGQIVEHTRISVIFPVYAVMAVLTMLLSARIPTDKPAQRMSLRNLNAGALFKNYRYVAYLLFAVLLFIPHRASFIFLPLLMESVGGTRAHLGLALSVMAFCEIPIFLMSNRIFKALKPLHLILLSSLFFILRQFIFSVAAAPLHIILNQILQGLGYGLFLMGSVYYIDDLAPDSLKSTAQTLATALFFGLSGIIGSFGGGWFIDRYGLTKMYQAGTLITLLNTLLFLLTMYFGKRKVHGSTLSSGTDVSASL